MFLDNQPASAEQLDLFRQIRVDQAIGLVTEAELEMELALDGSGRWVDFDASFLQPFSRVRVEVKPGEGDFVPLIDGPVVGQRMEFSATPNESRITLRVQDDSIQLNRTEAVALFEELTAADIARQFFARFGLQAEVDDTPAAGGTLERVVVQRGTAMQLLRELARRHGMFLYVKPGSAPGTSVGVFQLPDLAQEPLPELLPVGEQRNVAHLTIEFDGLRPVTASAASVDAASREVLEASAERSTQEALGDDAALDHVEAGSVLLARTRETDGDLTAAVNATVDAASWSYSASGEVEGSGYGAVLQPHATVSVAGIGPMSGTYLISRVTHLMDDQSYRQQFTLRRNARSSVDGGGGLPGGVF